MSARRPCPPTPALAGLALLMLLLGTVALLVPCLLAGTAGLAARSCAEALLGLPAGSWGVRLAGIAAGAAGFWSGLSQHTTRCALGELLRTGALLGAMRRGGA